MKHLLNFQTKQAFNMAQLNLEKPYIALTDDDGKVSLSNGYILNPNWYLKEGGNYYQMKQKEDGVGETSVSLLDKGWELTGSDDNFYYYKTIYSYLVSKHWTQIKVSWSGTTEMNFKYKSACSGGDESYDYLEFSKLDIDSFNPQDYGEDGPRADSEHIASSAKGTYNTEWENYTVHCDNGVHSLIFVFTTDGPCDENEYGEIAIPKKYVTYSVKKGDEIPTTYATDGKSAKIIKGQPTKVEYKAITLPNGNVILDMTDTQETQLAINTEYVDLGLPSGLKWAKCNVGAEKESDYGIMFAWGQTDNAVATNFVDSKNYPYSWATYEHCNGSYNTLTKYNTSTSYGENPDHITTLKPVDDAATQIMGGDWRMPTQDEFQELLDNTDKLWTTINGVNGYKFTSNKEGYQNNSIFIPAAGYCDDGSVYGVGNYGYVWSSSLTASNPRNAWCLYFYSGNCGIGYCNRYNGLSVRGVRK